MMPEQENFDQLRRLLALKRHEQPPPGYFNDFSGQVLARIKAGAREEGGTVLSRLFQEAPWIQRLWAVFEAKPALPGVFAALVCVLLFSAVIYSEKMNYAPANMEASASGTAITPTAAAPVLGLDQMAAGPMMASSTNPIVQPIGSLFDQISIDAQPASFRPGGN